MLTLTGTLYDEKNLGDLNFKEYIKKLMSEKFNGYICVTIHNNYGIEEGIILFHEGKIVVSEYLYLSFGKIYKKEPALERCLNAFLAENGIVEIYTLTEPQARLVTVIFEENKLDNFIKNYDQFLKIVPEKFNEEYELKELPEELEKDNKKIIELRKKLGITYKLEKESESETSIFKKLFGGKL